MVRGKGCTGAQVQLAGNQVRATPHAPPPASAVLCAPAAQPRNARFQGPHLV